MNQRSKVYLLVAELRKTYDWTKRRGPSKKNIHYSSCSEYTAILDAGESAAERAIVLLR